MLERVLKEYTGSIIYAFYNDLFGEGEVYSILSFSYVWGFKGKALHAVTMNCHPCVCFVNSLKPVSFLSFSPTNYLTPYMNCLAIYGFAFRENNINRCKCNLKKIQYWLLVVGVKDARVVGYNWYTSHCKSYY